MKADSLGSQYLVDICEKCGCPVYSYEGFVVGGATQDKFIHLMCVVAMIKAEEEES